MRASIVITTINRLNQNIINYDLRSNKMNWKFVVIGDKKTPKNFKLKFGDYYSFQDQKKLNFKFSKICPPNSYARKNIGYLISFLENDIIIETDDDNFPKKNFFLKRSNIQEVKKIENKSWINIYKIFNKNKEVVWPRGLPLDEINSNKIQISKKKKFGQFNLQQGLADVNPDVDAIFRIISKKINIRFKDLKINIGKSLTTFNSQNTTWFKNIFPLMYLPVTCPMRCTDIWRSLVVLKIMRTNNQNVLFFGTDMYQKRNGHNLLNDFEQEIKLYLYDKAIFKLLDQLKLKVGKKFYLRNLKICYSALIAHKFIDKSELNYLNAWIYDCKKLFFIKK
jgi:hypothetical protein